MKARAVSTRWLTHASFAPTAPDLRRRRWPIAAGLVALVLFYGGSTGWFGDLWVTPLALHEARREQAALQAEVERLKTRLAVEGATRRELEQQANELNGKVAELNRQVEFLTGRRAPGTRTK